MESYETGKFCTLKCLYFCSLLNLFALSVKPLDKRSFKASIPSCKASSICPKRKTSITEMKILVTWPVFNIVHVAQCKNGCYTIEVG